MVLSLVQSLTPRWCSSAGKAGVGDRRRRDGQTAAGSYGAATAVAAAAAAPPRWFVTADELSKVPSYMRGRLTLDKVRWLPLPMTPFAEWCSCKHTAVKWAVLHCYHLTLQWQRLAMLLLHVLVCHRNADTAGTGCAAQERPACTICEVCHMRAVAHMPPSVQVPANCKRPWVLAHGAAGECSPG